MGSSISRFVGMIFLRVCLSLFFCFWVTGIVVLGIVVIGVFNILIGWIVDGWSLI